MMFPALQIRHFSQIIAVQIVMLISPYLIFKLTHAVHVIKIHILICKLVIAIKTNLMQLIYQLAQII